MRITTETVVVFIAEESVYLIVNLNGGSGGVLVEVWDELEWVEDSTITTQGVNEFFTKGVKYRFTPSGGASATIPGAR